MELGLGLDSSWLCIAGVVASRAQWRFGIFAVGLQMAIKLNRLQSYVPKVLCSEGSIFRNMRFYIPKVLC